ncbi:1-(5-phosphoribosyl)-5-[(5-phosphoribosylamino)methylideneamino]imidazole-4-carboxamide isomerase [Candidatus Sororendozoicomonas aggregata]|uniref:1-(5-phosphoribosyl)-5-[(5- phosphoribosylamino)methylideneamino]imidazole-4- carboxamide isomerase n=1 Tax=Candidatus Sororendozoicomonas aggregata TaxID=3073239 RepID=UPI002ED4F04D
MIIPALDLINGQVVRLLQGDYGRVTTYPVDPAKQFARYHKAGAKWLHLVDLMGAKDPATRQLTIIEALLKSTPAKVQIGGGIRSEADVSGLFKAGADRVVIGSTAVKQPEQVKGWMDTYGAEKIVLALDMAINDKGQRNVAVSGWQQDSGVTIDALLDDYLAAGLIHVLCTDISCDGTLTGPNIALYKDLCRQFPAIEFQASGGVGALSDIDALKDTGVSGVIVGRALLDGRFTEQQAFECWGD